MDLNFSHADEDFRDEVRTWLRAHTPTGNRPMFGEALREYDMSWQRTQYEGGWAGISWPTEYGGRGMTLTQQLIWHEEYALAGAPDVGASFVGLNHGGPTLMARGTDDHKAFHLPPILRGDHVWCQGFSEPGAGSDLASLSTTGVVDGDQLVVTGQKTWTSYATVADYQELLVRTDRSGSKHQGMTWVIADMRSPGIDVRPITTLVRDHHFAEVFYDEVRIPLTNVVGRVDDGWSVAMSTLGFERGTAFMSRQVALSQKVERLLELARERVDHRGRPMIHDDRLADELATLRAEVAAMRAMTIAVVSRNARVEVPGPSGSLVKLYFGQLSQRIGRLAMEVIGLDGLEFDHWGWTGGYLQSYSTTIGGGTSEIQLNIIGERVLGLPR